jgi:hypothetical protein
MIGCAQTRLTDLLCTTVYHRNKRGNKGPCVVVLEIVKDMHEDQGRSRAREPAYGMTRREKKNSNCHLIKCTNDRSLWYVPLTDPIE